MSTDASVRRQNPGSLHLGNGLFPQPVEQISLYIHIPFCSSRCRYCNFYFETGWSPRVLDRTLDTILAESAAFIPWLFPTAQPRVHTVYFGGGTPSIIPPQRLDSFLAKFREIWQLPPYGGTEPLEMAFEANPESISWELLEVLQRHGINRLSLGVQSLSTDALQLLGRRAAEADVERALLCIKKARTQAAWTGKLNLDLIAGIPGQTPDSIAQDVSRLFAYQPDHFSLYTLTVEPETPLQQLFDQGLRAPLEDQAVEAIWDRADSQLEAQGFHNYEISNYAQAGNESLHNLAYWKLHPYLGLGPGAVGTIPALIQAASDAAKTATIVRLTNPGALAYSRPGRSNWEHAVEELSARDFLIDHFLTGFRIDGGINLTYLESIFYLKTGTIKKILFPLLVIWQENGWLDQTLADDRLGLSRKGRFVLNILLGQVMAAIDDNIAIFRDLPCPDWPKPLQF